MDTKPLIGISANYAENNSKLAENYYKSVVAAGGIPVIVPVTTDSEVLEKTVSLLDGIICSGGGDMSPSYYGEEAIPEMGEVNEYRDKYDYDLCMTAIRWQLPILGICRGMQTINIAFGGSLYQDIKAQADGKPFCHSQDADRSVATQTATIDKESLLYKIVGNNRLDINSIHHQAVKRIADGLRAVAHADDGICEAIESVHYPILGVQWHPEHLSGVGGDASAAVDNPHLN
ncbi:MAG: gamma-glutamyl-gamma-aminobutyrate hydrolase family protein, partial [Bacteroidetes bacterium]|nr:gamma-glutamyl-gamma-aminobutyrate hydrolase family protein [Bacteroidota bacterium]